MPLSPGTVRVGTSGWQYRHWVGPFYPQRTPAARMLGHYARHFSTAEVNSSFYRLPDPKNVSAWCDATPDRFVFACKANRFITHMKKLKDPAASLPPFLKVLEAFGDKAGPALFQLPPRWRANPGRLAAFLDCLPPGRRTVFEFRDPSWWTEDVHALLRANGAAFCLFDLAGTHPDPVVTADFVYVRLHGPGDAYQGSYTNEALGRWTARIAEWAAQGLDVYVYFDNDAQAHAPRNAASLAAMLAADHPIAPT